MKTVKDTLLEAADLIECVGHCKGMLRRIDSKCRIRGFCAYGALITVNADDAIQCKARRQLANVIGTFRLGKWNDAPERTAKDVIEAFYKAAEDL